MVIVKERKVILMQVRKRKISRKKVSLHREGMVTHLIAMVTEGLFMDMVGSMEHHIVVDIKYLSVRRKRTVGLMMGSKVSYQSKVCSSLNLDKKDEVVCYFLKSR